MKKQLLLIIFLTWTSFLSVTNAQWMIQNTNFSNTVHGVISISVPSANVAWAVGYNGAGTPITSNPDFAVTTNGGATWTAKKITASGVTTSFIIANISAIDGTTAFACLYDTNQTASQGIYKTSDGGTSWIRSVGAAYGTSSWPVLVHFFNANDGVAFGDTVDGYYEIYTTSNAGTSWIRSLNTANVLNPIPADEYALENAFGVFGNTICVGTNHGRIFRSTDKGVTWTVVATPLVSITTATDIDRIAFTDANNALAGSIYINDVLKPIFTFIKTTDGGATWTSVTSSGAVFGTDLCAVPGTNIYISTGADYTTPNLGSSMSSDYGKTWQLIEDTTGLSATPTGQRTAVKFFNSTLGYAGGFTSNNASKAGGIFKWSGPIAPFVGINNPSSSDVFVSVYPNPCADNLSIALSGILGKQTKINICNVVGQSVYQSSNTYNTPIFTKHIDIKNYPKGIYIVSVNDGTNVFVRKVIKE